MSVCEQRSRGESIDLAQRELSQAEEQHGKESLELCPLIENLASLYHVDGLYANAELLYRRALEISTKHGCNASIAVALNRLGMLYRKEAKYDDAESVYLRALAAIDEAPENARIKAERLSCLAGLYLEKNELLQSEQVLQKARESFHQIFGAGSLQEAFCELALASVCKRLGKSGESDEHYVRSKASAGKEAQDAGYERALLELAQTFYDQGRLVETDVILYQVVFSDEEKLWPDHPSVGQALHDRGELFQAQGQYKQAAAAFKRALEIRLRSLGNAHAEVGSTAMSLSILYLAENNLVEAEPVLKLAMKTRVRAFGVEHPSVAACIETYASLLKRTKRGAVALKLEARARDIRSKLVLQSVAASAGRTVP